MFREMYHTFKGRHMCPCFLSFAGKGNRDPWYPRGEGEGRCSSNHLEKLGISGSSQTVCSLLFRHWFICCLLCTVPLLYWLFGSMDLSISGKNDQTFGKNYQSLYCSIWQFSISYKLPKIQCCKFETIYSQEEIKRNYTWSTLIDISRLYTEIFPFLKINGTPCIFIYLEIDREREKERKRKKKESQRTITKQFFTNSLGN